MSVRRWVCFGALVLGCARRSVVIPRARVATDAAIAAAQGDRPRDASALVAPLRERAQLPVPDGTAVTLCGTVRRVDLMTPPNTVNPVWVWAVVLRGDGAPRVNLHTNEELTPWDGRPACASGRFYDGEPLAPGDPPYASRRTGWWLLDFALTEDPR